jgi:TRAP transporter TAXI family solute receptor
MAENQPRKFGPIRLPTRFAAISWRDLAFTLGPIVLVSVVAIWAAFWFVRPAPPDTITITTGPEGSVFQTYAKRYQKILARNGVKLQILPSQGSLENLRRLNDPSFRVDVGFVQGGVASGMNVESLVSLGSMFNQPLAIFYRSGVRLNLLSDLKGKRVTIGEEGSGAHVLALALLKANDIEPGGATTLLELSGEAAVEALLQSKADAAFLMGDSAAPQFMRKLMQAPGIRLFDFAQSESYVRRFRYLNKLELPMGSLDLGKNIPPRDLRIIGPTVELIAREDLHPALSDLLIEAATEVHGGGSLLQRAGDFPAPVEREFRISDHATRYYKSGKGFLYRYLPFWIASLVDRMAVLLVPVLVLLIPGMRIVPWLYRWRVGSRIYRWYGALLALERDMRTNPDPKAREDLLKRLDAIEQGVNGIKVPLAFADQFYVLREHITFVRGRLAKPETRD